MSAEAGEHPPPLGARLSPFVFPSDTTFRFLLLLVAVVGANLYVWNWLHTAVGLDVDDAVDSYLRCDLLRPDPSVSVSAVDAFDAASDRYRDCVSEVTRSLPAWMLGGTLLLLLVATAILFLLPTWIARRRRLRPLHREEAPAIVDELGRLSREAGLHEEPRWLWSPLDPSPTGLAFGRPGRHSVALNGGLVTRAIVDPPAFRAVVRHELAHLRNHDVDLTYATVALWYAFVLVGVAPFVAATVDQGLDIVLELGWRLVALALLVLLTRNAVLRAREVYADVRASASDGPDGALRRILAALPRHAASPWRRLWRVHPDPQRRLASINDTRRLFPLGIVVAFGVGVAATIAYESVFDLIAQFLRDPVTIHLLAATVFAPLAMAAVGVGVWRGAWGSLAEGAAPPRTWPYALALCAGLLLGPELALDRVVDPQGTTTLLRGSLGTGVLWLAALAIGLVLILSWVEASAQAWIRADAGTMRPTRATLAGLVVASGMLAFFVGIFFAIYDTRPALQVSRVATELEYRVVSEVAWVGPLWLYELLRDAYTLLVVTKPVVLVGLVAAWLFPLAAWWRRREQVGEAPWAFLEPGGHLRTPLLARGSADPWLVGVLAGVACLVAFLALRIGLRAGVEPATRAEAAFPFAFFYWQLVIALLAQGGASLFATARNRLPRMGLVAGLAAAFTTGVIATAGIMIGPTVAGCIDPIAINPAPCSWSVDAGSTWLVLRIVVAEGAVVALGLGIAALALQAARRRRHAPVAPQAVTTP